MESVPSSLKGIASARRRHSLKFLHAVAGLWLVSFTLRLCGASADVGDASFCIQPSTVRLGQRDRCDAKHLSGLAKDYIEWNAMRGERESAQLVLMDPPAGNFSLTFSDLVSGDGDVIRAGQLSYRQVMYVFCRNSSLERTNSSEWVADPLMPPDSKGEFPIEEGATQSVWISIDVPVDAVPSSSYTGKVTFSIQSPNAKVGGSVSVSLHVWNVELPSLAESSFTMTFSVAGLAYKYYKDSEVVLWKYFDMLTAYRMPPDNLYHVVSRPLPEVDYLRATGTQAINLLDIGGAIRALQGEHTDEHRQLGQLFLEDDAYAMSRRSTKEAECPKFHTNISDEVILKAVDILAPLVARAEEFRYVDQTYVYGFDEAPVTCLDAIRRVFGAVKARWPHLRTTAVLNWHSMPVDLPLDTWVMEYYLWDPSNTSTVHAAAKLFLADRPDRRLSFYHCVDPANPTQLNSFVDRLLIESRLLLWDAAATTPRVSGWLYYAVNSWQDTQKSTQFLTRINGTARSDFNVAREFGSAARIANGDGVLLYPGESGPVASVRMEAFRDGAEDVELLRLLPLDTAQALVRQLVRASNDFTPDSQLLENIRLQAFKEVVRLQAFKEVVRLQATLYGGGVS